MNPFMKESKRPEGLIHLDVNKALNSLGGRETIYRMMIETFSSEYGNADEAIVKHLQEGNRETARRLAHSIKSAAGQIGATALYSVSVPLEAALADKLVKIDNLMFFFQVNLEFVLVAISEYLDTTGSKME